MAKKKVWLALAMILLLSSLTQVSANTNSEEQKTPTGIPFSQLEDEVNAFMETHLGTTAPGAGVAVFHNGDIIFSGHYGYADLENEILVSASTVFEYGSTAKLLTYISVMQLVEQDMLDLDAPLRDYLPEDFYNQLQLTESFTMRDILNHATGFGQNLFNNFIITTEDNLTIPELTLEEVLLSTKPKQILKPGTGSSYSNFGVALAGFVVEHVSGQPFYQYLWENILSPIGMNHSAILPDWRDNPQILDHKAYGYVTTGNGDFLNMGWLNALPYPAGNINGTIEDLALFAISLMPELGATTPLFENSETLDLLLSPSYDVNGNMIGSHHGFISSYAGERLALGHGGNTIGFTTDLVIVPEERFGFVVSVNGGQESLIIDGLYELLIKDLSVIEEPVLRNDNLPNVDLVTGHYVGMDRSEGNILEFSDYFGLVSVNAVDENSILVKIHGDEAIFTQVEPYLFQLTEVNSGVTTWRLRNTIQFRMENDSVTHVVIGGGRDLTPLPAGRTMPILVVSLLIVIVSVLFLLISPVLLCIKILKRKKNKIIINKKFAHWQRLAALSSLALILNNTTIVVRLLIATYETIVSGLTTHIILNYVFGIGTILFIILAILAMRKGDVTSKSKVLFGLMALLIILYILLLVNWNFFTLY